MDCLALWSLWTDTTVEGKRAKEFEGKNVNFMIS